MTESASGPQTKVCPRCAEDVKAAARVCRYCEYEFEPVSGGGTGEPTTARTVQPADAAPRTPPVSPEPEIHTGGAMTTRQYPSSEPPSHREVDKATMLAAGYLVQSEGDDGHGYYNVFYVHGPNWRPAPPPVVSRPAPPTSPASTTRSKKGIGGGAIGTVLLLFVSAVILFATGGLNDLMGGGTTTTRPRAVTGGDAGTNGAWPSGFQDGICFGALFDLNDAAGHLAALADAAQNFDISRASNEASAVNDRARAAQDQLDALPDWPPAAGLVGDLRTAATSFRQGANLFQIAVKANDAAGLKEAAASIDSGSAALTSASADVTSLRSAYGFSCP